MGETTDETIARLRKELAAAPGDATRRNGPIVWKVLETLIAERKRAWDEGFSAAEHMARCWGHTDSWFEEPNWPTNPYGDLP